MPLPADHGPVRILQAQVVEESSASPSSVTTVGVANAGLPGARRGAEVGSVDNDGDWMDGGVPKHLDVDTYMEQFKRFRAGVINENYIKSMWGEATWDLMQAQMLVSEMEDREVAQGFAAGLLGSREPEDTQMDDTGKDDGPQKVTEVKQ